MDLTKHCCNCRSDSKCKRACKCKKNNDACLNCPSKCCENGILLPGTLASMIVSDDQPPSHKTVAPAHAKFSIPTQPVISNESEPKAFFLNFQGTITGTTTIVDGSSVASVQGFIPGRDGSSIGKFSGTFIGNIEPAGLGWGAFNIVGSLPGMVPTLPGSTASILFQVVTNNGIATGFQGHGTFNGPIIWTVPQPTMATMANIMQMAIIQANPKAPVLQPTTSMPAQATLSQPTQVIPPSTADKPKKIVAPSDTASSSIELRFFQYDKHTKEVWSYSNADLTSTSSDKLSSLCNHILSKKSDAIPLLGYLVRSLKSGISKVRADLIDCDDLEANQKDEVENRLGSVGLIVEYCQLISNKLENGFGDHDRLPDSFLVAPLFLDNYFRVKDVELLSVTPSATAAHLSLGPDKIKSLEEPQTQGVLRFLHKIDYINAGAGSMKSISRYLLGLQRAGVLSSNDRFNIDKVLYNKRMSLRVQRNLLLIYFGLLDRDSQDARFEPQFRVLEDGWTLKNTGVSIKDRLASDRTLAEFALAPISP